MIEKPDCVMDAPPGAYCFGVALFHNPELTDNDEARWSPIAGEKSFRFSHTTNLPPGIVCVPNAAYDANLRAQHRKVLALSGPTYREVGLKANLDDMMTGSLPNDDMQACLWSSLATGEAWFVAGADSGELLAATKIANGIQQYFGDN